MRFISKRIISSKGCQNRIGAAVKFGSAETHELTHFIHSEKNSSVRIRWHDQKYQKMAAKLASLVEDPIVDRMLQDKYGFDLVREYIDVLVSSQNIVRNRDQDPTNRSERIELMFSFSGLVLEWDLIKDQHALKEFGEFKTKFGRSYPRTSMMSKKLISIVRDIGIESLESRKTVCDEIIREFGLQKMIYVFNEL